jgi:NAD(P) transhydrogenase subunit alpha
VQILAGVDVVISTAVIPGKKAPLLITAQAVIGMQPGSVIIDCAAERGGNCELTRANHRVVTENGVVVLGPTNLPSQVPRDASVMYAKNAAAFLLHIVRDGALALDPEDEIVKGTLVTRDGEIVNKRVLESLAEVEHE